MGDTASLYDVRTFAARIAHEFRAPTRAIEGYATALQDDLGASLGDEHAHYLTRITLSARALSRLLDDFLDYTRIASATPSVAAVNVIDVLHTVVQNARNEGALAQVSVDIAGRCPPVSADSQLLSAALREVLRNAVTYVASGVTPTVAIELTDDGETATISFTDNGIGIDPEHHDRVFGLFERLHGIEQYPGYGIGLTRARDALARQGASIALRSALGAGTTVLVGVKLA